MKKTLSALIMVHNEEKILHNCLEKLNFCDEIVIILDKSSDNSEKICKKFTDKIFSGSWEFEGDRRNFGINKCTSDWILEIDADEHVSSHLSEEILNKINANNLEHSNFHIKINNYIGNNLIKHGWGGTFGRGGVTCLFKKGTKTWGRQRVHPELNFTENFGPDLKNPIEHYFVDNISELIKKFDRWTYLKSLDLFEKKENEKLSKNIRRVFSRFLKNYYKRKGYKEGRLGFLIALLAGLFPLVSFLRSEIKKNKKFKNIDN